MKQLILQDENVLDRIRILTENASQIIERYEYERELTAEEIAELQAEFSDNAIEQEKIKAERKALLEKLNEDLKKLEKGAKPMLLKIKNRRESVVQKVFVLEDDNTGEFGTYNIDGQLLRTEPAKMGDKRALKFNRIETSEEDEAKTA